MVKDAFYFSHDYNARNDRKISALVKRYRSAGYGIFWATCEMMHEEGGCLDLDEITLEAIASDLNEKSSFVREVLDKCINSYKLFVFVDNKLNSNRVSKNLIKRQDISEKRKKAANERHMKSKSNANAPQMHDND